MSNSLFNIIVIKSGRGLVRVSFVPGSIPVSATVFT
jgi:hypothetical protein